MAKKSASGFVFAIVISTATRTRKVDAHDEALNTREVELAVEGARAEIDRDRSHHADRVKPGERFKSLRHCEHENRHRDGDEQRNRGTPWRFRRASCRGISPSCAIMKITPIIATIAVLTALKSSRPKTTPTTSPNAVPNHGATASVAVMFAEKAEHVLFVLNELRRERFRKRKHRPAEKGCADHDFDCDRNDRFCRGSRDFRLLGCRVGIELHHAGDIGDRFHAAERQNHADELDPRDREIFVRRLEIRDFQMRTAECDDRMHHEHCRNREPNRNASAVFRSKIINARRRR